ncbi:hypothetical protein [Paenibacillus sp. YN15]|uniref:hypothetical protein n=1 Tax=Paenibacillus sp. YN15 TaxID=1742774 RepID=UPI000DCB01B3|nr:hypothetical protein [Paenibacillus sp. YN15]RAV06612.1 hypothetical protein DQG13_01940 [Paenibacillus sp. YN15]
MKKLIIGAISVSLALSLGACSTAPKPLDEVKLKSAITSYLSSKDSRSDFTITEFSNRKIEKTNDGIDIKVSVESGGQLKGSTIKDPAAKTPVHKESLYRAHLQYMDEQWVVTGVNKIEDLVVTPKEGINPLSLPDFMGRTATFNSEKTRYWDTKVVDQKSDLPNGTDTITLSKSSKNAIITESGTIKYNFTYNKESGYWEKTSEVKSADWKRSYALGGRWNYKFTSKDGYYVTINLYLSDVNANGEVTAKLDSDAIRAGAFSGLDMKTSWTAKASPENPFVFKSSETSVNLVIPDEGETNVIKLGDNIFRR